MEEPDHISKTLDHFIPNIQFVPSDYKEILLSSLSVCCHSLLGVLLGETCKEEAQAKPH